MVLLGLSNNLIKNARKGRTPADPQTFNQKCVLSTRCSRTKIEQRQKECPAKLRPILMCLYKDRERGDMFYGGVVRYGGKGCLCMVKYIDKGKKIILGEGGSHLSQTAREESA